MNIQAHLERSKIEVTKANDIPNLIKEQEKSSVELSYMKKMMVREIEKMDVIREPVRIRWFFNALISGYFNKELMPTTRGE